MPFDDQILLLPRSNYWNWLQACKEYAMTFGPNLTPDPGVAARYMAPRQVVTFPVFPGAYPEIGDPLAWFHAQAQGVRLDPIETGSPEALAKKLRRRVRQNDRYGARDRPFHLLWPTDYAVVTQPFGVNPQIYRRYGMPGHEGVDFRALTNSNVYACADGQVYEVYTDPKSHAYGIHVRVQHQDGYKTVYAHLARPLVHKGDVVQAGQLIGRADSTGNSSASHLHLSLKRDGATARQETTYPKDILDPTPFLVWPASAAGKAKALPRQAVPLGLNLVRAAGLGPDDVALAVRSKTQAVMVSARESQETIEGLRSAVPGLRLLARLGEDLAPEAQRPTRFVADVAADVNRLQSLGIRDFELGAYPNEHRAGFGWLWKDGAAFGEWLSETGLCLREVFPEIRLGYPCLAPGEDVVGRQEGAARFLRQSEGGAEDMDWIGVACALGGGNDVLQLCLAAFPEKPILVTELTAEGTASGPEAQAIRLSDFMARLEPGSVDIVLHRAAEIASNSQRPGSDWEAWQILAERDAFAGRPEPV
jgi:murein DD-endopeptidase MepM/ murein hydrolase activator NlpD